MFMVKNTDSFWTNINSPLYNWLEIYKIKISRGKIPPFSEGGSGRVYFLEKHVVKMSANRVEANVANMVSGRTDLPSSVIGVKYLGDNIYAILENYVETKKIPPYIKEAADYVMVMIDENPNMEGLPVNKKDQKKLSETTLKTNGGNIGLLPYMITIIDKLNKLYKATGFWHDDAGSSNIGIFKGKLVFPDLGPNETKDFNQLKTLVKIKKNRQNLGLPDYKVI